VKGHGTSGQIMQTEVVVIQHITHKLPEKLSLKYCSNFSLLNPQYPDLATLDAKV